MSSSASSPAGEEGDEGEGRVVGVREDILEEEVRSAAVLQGEAAASVSNINYTHVFTKNLTLKKRPTFPSLLASRMLTSVSVNTLFKLFGFCLSIWQPFDLQTLAALLSSVVVWADMGSADVAPEEVSGCRAPGNPS